MIYIKIAFIGVVDFSYHCLKEVIENDGDVVGIFTQKNSEFNSDYKDLTPLAKKHNIAIYYIDDINSDETFKLIQSLSPDVIFCFGWSQIIKERLLNYPKLGVIGVHPAKLPNNRGRHPLIWALFLGLKKSGLTFFEMDEGADTGDIISQKEFNIEYDDNASTLYKKIKKIATEQIKEFLPKLKNGTVKYKKQDKFDGNYWRKRGKIDGKIDWRMSSRAIYNLVRALTHPYVGAHCIYRDDEIKIWQVKEVKNNSNNIEPGKVLEVNGESIIVKVYDNAIEIVEHEFEILPNEGEYLK